MRGLILDGTATAAHDLSDGGLLVALAEMAMASGIGAALEAAPKDIAGVRPLVRRGPGALPRHRAGGQGRTRARTRAQAAGVPVSAIGTTGGDALTIPGERPMLVKVLRERFEGWLPAYMAGELPNA